MRRPKKTTAKLPAGAGSTAKIANRQSTRTVGFSGRSNSHQMKGWAVITDRVRATLEDDS
jgi:hypothetical protein